MEGMSHQRLLRRQLSESLDLNESLAARIEQLKAYIWRAGLEVPRPEDGVHGPIVERSGMPPHAPAKRLRTHDALADTSDALSLAALEASVNRSVREALASSRSDDSRAQLRTSSPGRSHDYSLVGAQGPGASAPGLGVREPRANAGLEPEPEAAAVSSQRTEADTPRRDTAARSAGEPAGRAALVYEQAVSEELRFDGPPGTQPGEPSSQTAPGNRPDDAHLELHDEVMTEGVEATEQGTTMAVAEGQSTAEQQRQAEEAAAHSPHADRRDNESYDEQSPAPRQDKPPVRSPVQTSSPPSFGRSWFARPDRLSDGPSHTNDAAVAANGTAENAAADREDRTAEGRSFTSASAVYASEEPEFEEEQGQEQERGYDAASISHIAEAESPREERSRESALHSHVYSPETNAADEQPEDVSEDSHAARETERDIRLQYGDDEAELTSGDGRERRTSASYEVVTESRQAASSPRVVEKSPRFVAELSGYERGKQAQNRRQEALRPQASKRPVSPDTEKTAFVSARLREEKLQRQSANERPRSPGNQSLPILSKPRAAPTAEAPSSEPRIPRRNRTAIREDVPPLPSLPQRKTRDDWAAQFRESFNTRRALGALQRAGVSDHASIAESMRRLVEPDRPGSQEHPNKRVAGQLEEHLDEHLGEQHHDEPLAGHHGEHLGEQHHDEPLAGHHGEPEDEEESGEHHDVRNDVRHGEKRDEQHDERHDQRLDEHHDERHDVHLDEHVDKHAKENQVQGTPRPPTSESSAYERSALRQTSAPAHPTATADSSKSVSDATITPVRSSRGSRNEQVAANDSPASSRSSAQRKATPTRQQRRDSSREKSPYEKPSRSFPAKGSPPVPSRGLSSTPLPQRGAPPMPPLPQSILKRINKYSGASGDSGTPGDSLASPFRGSVRPPLTSTPAPKAGAGVNRADLGSPSTGNLSAKSTHSRSKASPDSSIYQSALQSFDTSVAGERFLESEEYQSRSKRDERRPSGDDGTPSLKRSTPDDAERPQRVPQPVQPLNETSADMGLNLKFGRREVSPALIPPSAAAGERAPAARPANQIRALPSLAAPATGGDRRVSFKLPSSTTASQESQESQQSRPQSRRKLVRNVYPVDLSNSSQASLPDMSMQAAADAGDISQHRERPPF